MRRTIFWKGGVRPSNVAIFLLYFAIAGSLVLMVLTRELKIKDDAKLRLKLYRQKMYGSKIESKINIVRVVGKSNREVYDEVFEDLKQELNQLLMKLCKPNSFVLNIVNSYAVNFLSRSDIRSIQMKNTHSFRSNKGNGYPDLVNASHCTIFSVGFTGDRKIDSIVEVEIAAFRDTIRVPFVEEYRKMANKLILVYEAAVKSDLNFTYIVKSDDDVYVRFSHFLPYLYNRKRKIHMGGHVYWKSNVRRNTNDKWHMTPDEYPKKAIPLLVIGASCVLHRDVVEKISRLHYQVKLLPMEDVHITELVTKSGFRVMGIKQLAFCPYLIQFCSGTDLISIGRPGRFRESMFDRLSF